MDSGHSGCIYTRTSMKGWLTTFEGLSTERLVRRKLETKRRCVPASEPLSLYNTRKSGGGSQQYNAIGEMFVGK